MRKSINYDVFVKRMEIFRRRKGLNKKQLSNAIGKGDSYISVIAKGYHNPSDGVIEDICRVLEMPLPKKR